MYLLAAIYPTKNHTVVQNVSWSSVPAHFSERRRVGHFVKMEKTLCNVSGHKPSPLNVISNPTSACPRILLDSGGTPPVFAASHKVLSDPSAQGPDQPLFSAYRAILPTQLNFPTLVQI